MDTKSKIGMWVLVLLIIGLLFVSLKADKKPFPRELVLKSENLEILENQGLKIENCKSVQVNICMELSINSDDKKYPGVIYRIKHGTSYNVLPLSAKIKKGFVLNVQEGDVSGVPMFNDKYQALAGRHSIPVLCVSEGGCEIIMEVYLGKLSLRKIIFADRKYRDTFRISVFSKEKLSGKELKGIYKM